jgi:3-hydroxyisobutyrate dehydrogenase-like beta-hydroxyacid dehydrogenase
VSLTVGIVSPGAMGSAVGGVLAAGGSRVVATLAGRSERTRRLAAGLELLPGIDDVVGVSDVVLSIVPPGEALAVAETLAGAAGRSGARPLVAELNAISPATAAMIDGVLAEAGLELVDGSISGPPPREAGTTRIYLSGPRAAEVAALPAPGLELRVVGPAIGTASAVKMCTGSIDKGTTALLAHALLTARAHGVVAEVVDDLDDSFSGLAGRAPASLARAAAKADRYADEMREIAATQAAAGVTPALFEALAEVYATLARSPLAELAPEDADPAAPLDDVLARLLPADAFAPPGRG